MDIHWYIILHRLGSIYQCKTNELDAVEYFFVPDFLNSLAAVLT